MDHPLSRLQAIGLFLLPSAFLILVAMALAYSDSLEVDNVSLWICTP